MSESVKEHLLGKLKALTDRNKAILEEAEAGHRDLLDAETTEFQTNMKQIEEARVEIKGIEDREEMKAQLDALSVVTEIAEQEPTIQVKARTPGDAVINSAEYKAIIDRYHSEGMPQFGNLRIEHKTAGDPVLLSDGQNQTAVQEGWDPRLFTPDLTQYPLRVAQLLGQVQASGNITRGAKVITRTGPSGNPTAEGATKKGVVFEFDDVSITLEKNTAFGGASDELFADAPALSGYITNQIGLMVDQVEETAVTAVLYAAADTVDGSTVHASSPNGFDAIRAAMNAIHIAGGVPDAVLIYPTDAALLDTLRSASSDQYYGGGPVGGPRDAWWGGLRLVLSTAADPGRPLVGAYRAGATLYSRGGTVTEFSNSHSTFFAEDKVAIRSYKRSKAFKHNPEWFVQCDIGAS
ncbi:MAG: phage major capsid protein [Actinomycetota bacterium]